MLASTRIKRLLAGAGVIFLTIILGYLFIRQFHLRWGAADDEVARAMPGDLAIPGWTRAVTINAPAEQVWPWVAQWGQGRGGWYSYDWLENLLGFNIHTAEAILPEFQRPQIGDPICMADNACISQVFIVEPPRFFGWQALQPDGAPAWTFVIGLYPIDADSTRLIIRESFGAGAMPAPALVAIEIPDAVMELKALDTVKQSAEGAASSPWITLVEIGLWLAALGMGAAAGVLMLRRTNAHPVFALALGVDAIIVLLLLTFLYLPLWLRFVLDAALAGGLFWLSRSQSKPQDSSLGESDVRVIS